jgi:hypothetical protein
MIYGMAWTWLPWASSSLVLPAGRPRQTTTFMSNRVLAGTEPPGTSHRQLLPAAATQGAIRSSPAGRVRLAKAAREGSQESEEEEERAADSAAQKTAMLAQAERPQAATAMAQREEAPAVARLASSWSRPQPSSSTTSRSPPVPEAQVDEVAQADSQEAARPAARVRQAEAAPAAQAERTATPP